MIMVHVVCAAGYAALGVLIIAQARRSRTGLLLAAAAGATALWAAAAAMAPNGLAATLDLLRLLAWYGFCLHLYRKARPSRDGESLFTGLGLGVALAAAATALLGRADLIGAPLANALAEPVSLLSPPVLLRLALAICQLLLLENFYRATPPERRWHVGLACIALGGLAAYDVMVCADAVLSRAAAPSLLAGRAMAAVLVAPLLALAAARNRQWRVDIHLSRTAAFHSATLVGSGVFLLALAAAGELAQQFGDRLGAATGWGSLAEICVVFAGVLAVLVLLTSGTARGALRRRLVDHFFTHRYDYRREWQRCIDILAAPDTQGLPERVVRALGETVDSGSGLLFLREPGPAGDGPSQYRLSQDGLSQDGLSQDGLSQDGLSWAGSWNTPPAGPLDAAQARILLAAEGPRMLPPDAVVTPGFAPWLVVPLRDPDPAAARPMGCVVLARPRGDFRLDAEVFDLLRILAHEVAIHLAQQRAAARLLQTAELRAYGERFAFVAHDIKNVSSQLSLLLSNAETHLADPAFQRDMLGTVRASVDRIGGLIRRLEPARDAAPSSSPPSLDPAVALTNLLAARPREIALDVEPAAAGVRIGMEAAAFAASVTHLLDNAITAAGPDGVRVRLRATATQAVVDIEDDGPGMTAEFLRDCLFTPFVTRTEGGSGIGAFQARELARGAGGEVTVRSTPDRGTTMRLSLPRAAQDGEGSTLDPLGPTASDADDLKINMSRDLRSGVAAC